MAGSTTARGYGTEHQRTRKQWAVIVARGGVECRRASNGTCIAPSPLIKSDEPWQLGHPDETCPAPLAPEHRLCNASTMTTERREARKAPVRIQSRRW